jgi:hypothetical protein
LGRGDAWHRWLQYSFYAHKLYARPPDVHHATTFLEDVGGAHGRIADHRASNAWHGSRSIFWRPSISRSITFFLDAPVSSSGRQAGFIREAFARRGINAEVRLENGVDHFLAYWEGELIATADSAIIARTKAHVFDLARYILERQFSARFPQLASFLE